MQRILRILLVENERPDQVVPYETADGCQHDRIGRDAADSFCAIYSGPAEVEVISLDGGDPHDQQAEDQGLDSAHSPASSNGGVVLELGFGLGISAGAIQQYPIEKHIIVEANKDVFGRLEAFAAKAEHPVTPLFGLWEEIMPTLAEESIDGILFDIYITSFEDADQFTYAHFPFLEHAYRVLRKGGIFTYFSSEIDEYSPIHLKALQDTGFSSIEKKICPMSPPADCLYWKSDTIVAPIIKK